MQSLNFDEDELDPITGLPVSQASPEMGPPAQTMPAPPPAAAPADMNPTVKDYLMKKFDLGEYNDENRKNVVADSQLGTGDRVSAALSAIGAGFSGGDAGAAAASRIKAIQDEKNKTLDQFDKGRKDKIETYNLNKELTADQENLQRTAREKDPNSAESKVAQDLAKRMGFQGDPSTITADKFKAFSPALEKIYAIEQKKLDRQEARADKKQALAEKGTEGQKAVDKDYAKEYNEWTATGKASLIKNLDALKEARDALKKDPSLTGGLTGVLGDRMTADRVLKQRQKVGSAIQSSLKATLGAQFTEKEGERTLKNAYNEAASPDTNAASLDALIKQLEAQGRNNEEKAHHFESKGTLQGFHGNSIPSSSGKQVSKKQFSPSRNQTRITYSDGSEEIVDGKG